jgi:hypothetical protein
MALLEEYHPSFRDRQWRDGLILRPPEFGEYNDAIPRAAARSA